MQVTKHPGGRLHLLLAALTLVCVGTVIFRQFLFGNAVLLYKDIGSDSLISYYPDFVQLSRYIRTEGNPSWSFYVGMGQDLAYAAGFLIWQPVSWLSAEWIAHALVYQHLAKVIIAGLLFFSFLRLLRLNSIAALLGSLFLSFSAYMCMGSCWYPLADEVVVFAAVLLGVEQALTRGRWLLLAIAVALTGMINPFFLYLCALFLSVYVPGRLFAQHGWQPRLIFQTALPLALVALLGVGLGAFVSLPSLDVVLKSPRGLGPTSVSATIRSFPVFGFASARHYFSVVLRQYSNDLLGTGDAFRGWQNYLEAPLSYCGLLPLLLFPQIFRDLTPRQRVGLILLVASLVIPTLFPWFRYLFWLFEGNYYRTFSLFWALAVISLSMIAFSRYAEGVSLNLWLLGATALVLLAVLYLPITDLQALVGAGLRRAISVYLTVYTLVLIAGQFLTKQRLACWVLVGLAAVELIHFDYITVSNRDTVTKDEIKVHTGYPDETVDVVRELAASDTGFFRLTKLCPSAPTTSLSLNDAMVLGYFGTSSYSSFNNGNYIGFLTAVGAVRADLELSTRWSIGLLRDPLLSTFACEKYSLVDDPTAYEGVLRYDLKKRYGKQFLFHNQLFLPLGLTFTRYITEDVFLRLSPDDKADALFRWVVLSNEKDDHGLTALNVSELQKEITNTPLAYVMDARRSTGLQMTSFHQTRIQGTVNQDQKSVLVLQMPFDRGWRAFVNGRVTPVVKVDAGLLGLGLDAGEQTIELRYRNAFLAPALAITIAALAVLVAGLWRWPRLKVSYQV